VNLRGPTYKRKDGKGKAWRDGKGRGMGGMGKDGWEGEERKGERERKAGKTVPMKDCASSFCQSWLQA